MKRRYPVITAARTRAAADGRSLVSPCTVVITDAASRLAAAAKCRVPGQDRRQDLPGVRSRPGDWRVPQAGYLQEATPDTRGPGDGAAAGPGYAPPPCPPRGSRRIQPGPGSSRPGRTSRWPVSSARPARPPPRTAAENSARCRIRAAAGSTGYHRGTGWLRRSDTDPGAALAAPRGENGAAGPGAHAQPEPVRLRAAAVVRLERTLAHWGSRYGAWFGKRRCRRPGPGRFRTGRTGAGWTGPMHVTRISRRGSNCPAACRRAAGATTLFAQRAPEPGPRLWTKVRGERAPRGG